MVHQYEGNRVMNAGLTTVVMPGGVALTQGSSVRRFTGMLHRDTNINGREVMMMLVMWICIAAIDRYIELIPR